MALRDNGTYQGTVAKGYWMESQKGTPGFAVDIETDEGDFITHVLWATERNREGFARDMATLGVSESNLRNGGYLEHQLPLDVQGRAIRFGTRIETYKEKTQIKVSWIGAPRESTGRGTGFDVAAMFGGASAPATGDDKTKAAISAQAPIEDDDIPF